MIYPYILVLGIAILISKRDQHFPYLTLFLSDVSLKYASQTHLLPQTQFGKWSVTSLLCENINRAKYLVNMKMFLKFRVNIQIWGFSFLDSQLAYSLFYDVPCTFTIWMLQVSLDSHKLAFEFHTCSLVTGPKFSD